MKPVLAWIKNNPLIVVFSALILLLLPTAWFVSSWWSNKIKSTQEKLANADYQRITAAKIDYTIPSHEPGAPAITHKDVPNRALIKWFDEQRKSLADKAGDLVKRAEQFNKGIGPDAESVGRTEHRPLVDGLFPPPANRDEGAAKLNEMEDALLGQRGKSNPYQQMLDAARAGPPADGARVADIISGLQDREKEKITAGKRDLTAEEQATLAKMLADRRLAEYQSRVSGVSFYATMESLPHDTKGGGVYVPTGQHLEASLIEPVRLFLFQWDYWFMQDLISAVKLANTSATGKQINVDQAIVKRIVSIEMETPEGLSQQDDSGRAGSITGQGPAVPVAAVPGMVPLDPSLSITGRGMGSWNTVYDVRRAKMTVIVSSAHLQEFLEAIPRTNFMSVTDLDLAEVDTWGDLRKGYYYGSDHVVRATVGVESVWLRSWMVGYMPSPLKAALKIPEPPPADPSAPPVPPVPPAPGKGPG